MKEDGRQVSKEGRPEAVAVTEGRINLSGAADALAFPLEDPGAPLPTDLPFLNRLVELLEHLGHAFLFSRLWPASKSRPNCPHCEILMNVLDTTQEALIDRETRFLMVLSAMLGKRVVVSKEGAKEIFEVQVPIQKKGA